MILCRILLWNQLDNDLVMAPTNCSQMHREWSQFILKWIKWKFCYELCSATVCLIYLFIYYIKLETIFVYGNIKRSRNKTNIGIAMQSTHCTKYTLLIFSFFLSFSLFVPLTLFALRAKPLLFSKKWFCRQQMIVWNAFLAIATNTHFMNVISPFLFQQVLQHLLNSHNQ